MKNKARKKKKEFFGRRGGEGGDDDRRKKFVNTHQRERKLHTRLDVTVRGKNGFTNCQGGVLVWPQKQKKAREPETKKRNRIEIYKSGSGKESRGKKVIKSKRSTIVYR